LGINLAIEKGERHSIIGPNGAGKSTLFNLVTGKYKPSKGRIIFRGEDITGWSPFKINHRGLARSFQVINIFPNMTVFENLRNAILSKKGMRFNMISLLKGLNKVQDEANDLLETLGLMELSGIPAGELSYGQQRALEIGLTLATDPELILLDEPTYGEILATGSPQEIREDQEVKKAYLGSKK